MVHVTAERVCEKKTPKPPKESGDGSACAALGIARRAIS